MTNVTKVEVLVLSDEDVESSHMVAYESDSDNRNDIASEALHYLYFLDQEGVEDHEADALVQRIQHVEDTCRVIGSSYVYFDEGGMVVVNFI